MKKISVLTAMLVTLLASIASPSYALQSLSDNQMSAVTGQAALILSQYIPAGGTNPNANISFYRMVLNANLKMNMNIDHLQLGCGGFNNQFVPNACDVDIDDVRLMGRGAGQPGAPGAGAAGSDFIMTRPYLTFAIKNDSSPTSREFVGLEMGSAQSDGFMGIGQYNPNASGCDPNADSGPSAVACNFGINRLSGYTGMHMTGGAYGCFTLNPFASCTPNPVKSQQDQVAKWDQTIFEYGTRLDRIITKLTVHTCCAALVAGISLSTTASVNASLRMAHGLSIDPTQAAYAKDDFFMSFQRETVLWPAYNKNTCAAGGVGGNGTNPCYAHPANAGWWMNVPDAELTGLKTYGVAAGISSLGGITMTDPDFNQRPPDNCYGSLTFC